MKSFINKLLKKSSPPSIQRKGEVQVYFPITTELHKEQISQPAKRQDIGEDEQIQQQILNTLVKMNELLKITKITKELRGEHLTLCHNNRLLCEEMIDVRGLRKFLLNKTSESILINEETDYPKGIDKVDKNANKNNVIQHYTTFSNGIIFQFYSVRALLWKIIIKYLPASKNKWISLMEGKLIHYNELIKDYVLEIVVRKKKKKDLSVQNTEKTIQIQKQTKKKVADHPLNSLKDSKWKTFFEDQQLWHLIQKDTMRTKPSCKFFNEQFQIEYTQETLLKHGITKNQVHLSKEKQKTKTYYFDCLTRIIYTFLKRNPEHHYCQGMNELAALIFYSFANKNSEYFRRIAESDAYFCFQKIIVALMKLPVPGFLNGEKYSHRFQELLKKVDLRLFQELESKAGMLNSLRILSIKWFGSLFLNEFQIDESLILWDGFLATLFRQQGNETVLSFHNLLMSIGLALIHLNRSKLQKGQNPMLVFSKITHHPEAILEKALNLYKIFKQLFQ